LFKSGEIFARKRCQAVETDTLSVKSGWAVTHKFASRYPYLEKSLYVYYIFC
jgi:hypothetical protein